MAYSRDFRRKVLAVRNKEGLTIAEAAARFDVGSASVVRWIKNVERKPQEYRRRKIDLDALRKDFLDYPDAYQHQRAQRFGVAQIAIFVALKKLQLTYKKTLRHPKADEDERGIFRDKMAAYGSQHRTIVYIDESGCGDLARLSNNAMLAADPASGEIRRFLTGPVGCEVTGATATPDGRTMFVNIQHPGESPSERSDPDQPRRYSNWPDFRPDGRPRSATVVIRKNDGGVIGS